MTLAKAIAWCKKYRAHVQFRPDGLVSVSVGISFLHNGYTASSFQEAVEIAACTEACKARMATVEMP